MFLQNELLLIVIWTECRVAYRSYSSDLVQVVDFVAHRKVAEEALLVEQVAVVVVVLLLQHTAPQIIWVAH